MLEFKFFSQLIVKTGVTTKTSDVTHCFFQYKQKLIKKKEKKGGLLFQLYFVQRTKYHSKS